MPPLVNEAGDTAQIPVILTTSPQSEETAETCDRLRDDVIPEALEGFEARGLRRRHDRVVRGHRISDRQRMWLFLLYIIGITCLILTMAFRSIVVAVKAALTTMLSAFAAFGALTAVFEWGFVNQPGRPGRHRSDRVVHPDDGAVDPLRAVDGLRGLPGQPDPGGVRPHGVG